MLRIPFSIFSDESNAKKVRGAYPTRLNLLNPTAVAENLIAGGVGEVTGAISSPRPDRGFVIGAAVNSLNSIL
jgi:hypothetical protein